MALYQHGIDCMPSVILGLFHRPLGWYCSYCAAKWTTGIFTENKTNITTEWMRHTVCCFDIETDRNPNFWYLPKTNILLKPNYSAMSRIAEYRIVPTISSNSTLFGFGRIFCSNILQNIMPKQGFGRTLLKMVFRPL